VAPFYTYSKSKGLYGGVSLEGTFLYTRKDCNRAIYGRSVRTSQIISGSVARPPAADPLYRMLNMRFGNLGAAFLGSGAVASPSASPAAGVRGSPAVAAGPSPVFRAASPAAASLVAPVAASAPTTPRRTVTALYDFAGQSGQDLSFRQGDRITVLESTPSKDDWWTGELNGKTGTFPANYVS
jgi:SH3 domain-containing YSC84-like protein 1